MYQWMIWFHITSLISWFAVLFYMPRLFVYDVENADNEGFQKVIKVMEMKIYKYIGIPAFWATAISGTVLAFMFTENFGGVNIFATGGWFHAKLLFVVLLIIYFFSMGYYRKQLLEGRCTKSGKFFRVYNEGPTVLMLLIVAMVVVKPF